MRKLILLTFLTFYCVTKGLAQLQTEYTRQFVTVAGKKMSYESFGLGNRHSGLPVFVFEGGYGVGGAKNFEAMFPELSKISAGIAYDRNGEGESDEDSSLTTDSKLVIRLHDFLEKVRVTPPYILVGHSMGGAYIRLFTSMYPTEVAGMIFIDPADFMLTKEQDDLIKSKTPGDVGRTASVYPFMEKDANDSSHSVQSRNRAKRLAQLMRSGYFSEYDSLTHIPDIPIDVLIAYHKSRDSSKVSAIRLARFNAEDDYKIENYATMIENNHNSSVIVLTKYGHFIHREDPDYVIGVIKNIYQKSISKKNASNIQ
jgi:pimeloyl-ACP methyl ester carboxylesterase